MKKLSILLAFFLPLALVAQKDIKPSIPKADKALRENKLDEAKAIIDAATASDDFMKDKKGAPSKNAAKAWFYKGMIYAAIDTTHEEQFKSLEAEPFKVAKQAFEKATEVDGGKSAYFVSDANGFPIMTDQIYGYIAQAYLNRAIVAYDEEKDYKKALELTENTLYFIPEDTSILMNAGVYFAPAANEDDKAIAYMREYIAKGGTSPDPYIQMVSIYRDKKKDMDAALKVSQEAMKKFPDNPDFPRFELDIFIKTNRLPEAKDAMERQIEGNTDDKESRYFLGVINSELKDYKEARRWYEEALKIDPKYFEPAFALAELVYVEAKKVKQEMNQLGITKEDQKKRYELDKVYVDKLKLALPYFETAEKINPDDEKVLDNLLGIYSDLDNQAQVARIEKKMKTLGLLD